MRFLIFPFKQFRFLLSILLMILLVNETYAQFESNVTKTGTVAAPFLSIGAGSRAEAMGGAFVATADDASALYWNPAGIARIKRPELITSHSEWLAGMSFDYAGVVIPLGNRGSVGASFTSLSSGDMEVRTVEQPDGTGELFSALDIAIQFSGAVNLTDRFSIGFNGKYINQKIWKESASAFALDIGTLFTTGFRGLRIGATLSNFGNDMKLEGNDLLVYHDVSATKYGNNDQVPAELQTEAWPLPLNFQIGVAMEVLQTEDMRVTVAADAMHPSDNTESINMGAECAYSEFVFLRGGMRNLFLEDGEEGFTMGIGIKRRFLNNFMVRFDYSYNDFGDLGKVQRYSLGFGF